MVGIVEINEEIMRNSINFIWKATRGKLSLSSRVILIREDNKKKLCEYCGCSVCDRGHILLCDDSCGKNFHTRCLNPPLTRIPAGNCTKDTSDSDDEDSQNIRKFSKKTLTDHNKKSKTLSNSLGTKINSGSINDSIENRVESIKFPFPIVVIERMNALVVNSSQSSISRSPTSLHSVNQVKNQVEGSIEEDNTSNEDNLQV
ncbi:hypothetical protein C2G38_2243357 [Gigaspora rosea]|uniref:PHD-type domain-containing protein n=1 Tax=Gigaspora rosea TaxID=44941 RepID=A0A397VKJ5_9GLOM|nr:hypothetical protein C2G38_2243357 [Gigaspora rosea]